MPLRTQRWTYHLRSVSPIASGTIRYARGPTAWAVTTDVTFGLNASKSHRTLINFAIATACVHARRSPDFVFELQTQVDVVEVARGVGAAKAGEDLPAIGRIEEGHGLGLSSVGVFPFRCLGRMSAHVLILSFHRERRTQTRPPHSSVNDFLSASSASKTRRLGGYVNQRWLGRIITFASTRGAETDPDTGTQNMVHTKPCPRSSKPACVRRRI